MRNGSLAIMTSFFHVRIDPDRFRKRRGNLLVLSCGPERGRRAYSVEAVAQTRSDLQQTFGNSIDPSNTLHKTYAPVSLEAVRNVDDSRLRGRQRMRAANKVGVKVSLQQPIGVSPERSSDD